MCGHLIQYSVMDHTVNLSMSTVDEVYDKQLCTLGLWLPELLNSLLWGTLKDRVMWTTQIHWMSWKTVLKVKLKAFHDKSAIVCGEIFSEVVRPA
jgi:hypothetical protein